jgi:hypothetical protein
VAANVQIIYKLVPTNDFMKTMRKRAEDATNYVIRAGQIAVDYCRKAFSDQSFGGTPWPARKTPSIMGVAQDLSVGPTVREERFRSRPALYVTGALKNSIGWEVQSRHSIRIISRLPYAKAMQEGGQSKVIRITKTVRRNLAEFLRGHPQHRKDLAFMFNVPSVSSDVKPRPFIGITPDLADHLQALARDFLMQRGEFHQESGSSEAVAE